MKISYQKELEKIKEILKTKPRGVTTNEIAKKLGINRNVVGKYLDVLQMSGDVDVEQFGRSKVYFPAKSIPVSSMFDYSNDFLIVVTKDMETVEINNPFLRYLGLPKKDRLIGKNIQNLSFTKEFPKMTEYITDAFEKQEILVNKIQHKGNNTSKPDYFRVKFVPTILKDGEKAITVILTKI